MPFYYEEPEGSVGVGDYGRFVIHDGMMCCVERYPWPFKHPILWVESLYHIALWHRDMIRQHGFSTWNHDRKF